MIKFFFHKYLMVSLILVMKNQMIHLVQDVRVIWTRGRVMSRTGRSRTRNRRKNKTNLSYRGETFLIGVVWVNLFLLVFKGYVLVWERFPLLDLDVFMLFSIFYSNEYWWTWDEWWTWEDLEVESDRMKWDENVMKNEKFIWMN